MATYSIAKSRFSTLQAKIRNANEKLVKHGQPALTMAVVSEWSRMVAFFGGRAVEIDAPIPMVTVEITGEALTIAGHRIVAVFQATPGGEIVTSNPEAHPLTVAPSLHCDHCGTDRMRNDVFVVQGPDGQQKRVGRNCLADYVRDGSDVAGMLRSHNLRLETWEWLKDFCGGGGSYLESSAGYLAAVIAVSERYGFTSKKVAEQKMCPPTAELAWAVLRHDDKPFAPEAHPTIKATHFDMAEAVIAWAGSINARSDYEVNLRAVCRAEFFDARRHAGILASAYSAFEREMNRRAEQAARAKATAGSAHQAAVGEKVERDVTIAGLTKIDGAYGTTTIVTMIDAIGNVYKWFASNPPRFERNQAVKVRGTVKKHDSYRGTAQTVLTRCKVL